MSRRSVLENDRTIKKMVNTQKTVTTLIKALEQEYNRNELEFLQLSYLAKKMNGTSATEDQSDAININVDDPSDINKAELNLDIDIGSIKSKELRGESEDDSGDETDCKANSS